MSTLQGATDVVADAPAPPATLALSYVLPLAAPDDEDVSELASYLRWLAAHVDDIIVVDGSSPAAVRTHRAAFGSGVRVVEPAQRTLNGKVGNVVTGVSLARHGYVVIADDDVRYEVEQLADVQERLRRATVVRPQNYFDPLPWHARFDTARTVFARATGGDWSGTTAIHRDALLAVGGYDGEVLFENLELARTLRAAGGRDEVALDVLVRRLPPTASHFRGQQVRQAYDEFARPGRLALWLAVTPAAGAALATRRYRALLVGGAGLTLLGEVGRRRAGGQRHLSASASLLTPVWALWRSLCSWVAVGAWLRGGVKYRGRRLRRAATSDRQLRRRLRHGASPGDGHPAGTNG
jgi:hypothetical protein